MHGQAVRSRSQKLPAMCRRGNRRIRRIHADNGCRLGHALARTRHGRPKDRPVTWPGRLGSTAGATAGGRVTRHHNAAAAYMTSAAHSCECGNSSTHHSDKVNGARIDTPMTKRDSHHLGRTAASGIIHTRYQGQRWATTTNEIALRMASEAFTMLSGTGSLTSEST